MAVIKVQQKLGQAAFAVLHTQIKTSGVHVINEVKTERVSADDVIGRVHNAFNLGNKIEVTLAGPPAGKNDSYRFEKINDVYYLVRK